MTKDELVKLAACPFCGGKAQLALNGLDERFGYATEYIARCSQCPAQIKAVDKSNPRGGYALKTGRAEAIKAWNTRTTTTGEAK
jgi:Lar family restriction alleviation protein